MKKPTAKELRQFCEKNGVNPPKGKSLDVLLSEAMASDDPMGWLETFATGPLVNVNDTVADHTAASRPKAAMPCFPTLTISVPFNPEIAENATVAGDLHLDVQLRRLKSQRAFKKVWSALIEDRTAKLANGRPVHSMANVVEWIIERIADAVE